VQDLGIGEAIAIATAQASFEGGYEGVRGSDLNSFAELNSPLLYACAHKAGDCPLISERMKQKGRKTEKQAAKSPTNKSPTKSPTKCFAHKI
jgi:hypothetical protein